MPVFISEIVFRGAVGGARPEKPEAETSRTEKAMDRERLIEDCVAEVMRLLRRREER
ncbi:hypothetical protein G5B40_11565 [Pikeienuella piscinae]|uniref:Uncharacterized protein n=1 Tax=Pikeienuella piscinae TaxID=2748098 RepID=A0A7L5BY21_9RHOB|nr:DUF5908 family protein [Pikeienuella piscinae]QIE56033.1 hypothetical protein G5B40_11565 [Pikeienuella piscinae]